MFAITYSVFGILMGIAAGKYNKKKIFLTTLFLSSAVSVMQGTVNSFALFALGRVLMGMTMSASDPFSFSLVPDYVPQNLRSLAYGIIASGTYLGGVFTSL